MDRHLSALVSARQRGVGNLCPSNFILFCRSASRAPLQLSRVVTPHPCSLTLDSTGGTEGPRVCLFASRRVVTSLNDWKQDVLVLQCYRI